MKKIISIFALFAATVIFVPGQASAADLWAVTGPVKSAKVAVTLSYNTPGGLKTVTYKPDAFTLRVERKPDLVDAYFPRIYTNISFSTEKVSFNASMTGSGLKSADTTLVNASVDNGLENNSDADYPAFDFSDTTAGCSLSMANDAMLTSTAEGSFTERVDSNNATVIDISMKYTVMGTLTLNGLDFYPAKLVIAVAAKGAGGA